MGYNGERDANTPCLNRFAKHGITFSHAIAQGPYTTTSIPSLLTGRYPSQLKPLPSDKIAGVCTLHVRTLAELLKQAGYHTAAFHSNPLLSRVFGYERGFDTFYDDLFLRGLRLPQWVKLTLNRIQRTSRIHPYVPAGGITKKALAWLKEAKEPFFLWLHYMDTHGPYQLRQGLQYLNKIKAERLWHKAVKQPEAITKADLKQLKATYLEEVAYLDQQLGVFFDELARSGQLERSLLIFTSDHGDAFGEHGYFAHHHQLYEELIRVPLIIYIPLIKSRTIEKPVGLVNLTPTIIDFTGIEIDEHFDGQSLRLLIENRDEGYLPDFAISEAEFDPYIGAIRTAEWKFIMNEQANTKELYQLTKDPGEQRDVAQDHPDIAKELETKLQEHLSGSESVKGEPEIKLSQKEQNILEDRLRDLGYL